MNAANTTVTQRKRITLYRRLSQAFFFALIVYGGFVVPRPLDVRRNEIVDSSGYRGKYELGHGVRLVEREKPTVALFLPVTSCYYQHQGFFSGCSLAFVSEHLTFLTPLIYILPQLLVLLVLLFVFGRLGCGWACPFGTLGDLLTWLRKLTGKDHVQPSRALRNALIWIKYGLLAASLVLAVMAAFSYFGGLKNDMLLAFCQVCLGKVVSAFLSGGAICWTNFNNALTGTLSVLGLIAFGLFIFSFALRRGYCRICPIGGIAAPFNRYGLLDLHKDAQKCTNCGVCARVCAVDNRTVLDARETGSVAACECTLCLRCVEACPEPDCLELTFMGKTISRS